VQISSVKKERDWIGGLKESVGDGVRKAEAVETTAWKQLTETVAGSRWARRKKRLTSQKSYIL